jgi:hypothetical protein
MRLTRGGRRKRLKIAAAWPWGTSDHHRLGPRQRPRAGTLTSSGTVPATKKGPRGPWNPGHPVRQPGYCHTPAPKIKTHSTARRRFQSATGQHESSLPWDFTGPAPNRRWVTDFIHVASAGSHKPGKLVLDALQMALCQRGRDGHPAAAPRRTAPRIVLHSRSAASKRAVE